jgi:hypothetical protein
MGTFTAIGLVVGVVGFQIFGAELFHSPSGLNWKGLLAAAVVGGICGGLGAWADQRLANASTKTAKALNRSVGKGLLRFFGLVGATLSGLWVLGTILHAVVAILQGGVEGAAAQMLIGRVAGSAFVFLFFVLVFRRVGPARAAAETRRRPSLFFMAIVGMFVIIMGGARLLATTQPRVATSLAGPQSTTGPKTASTSTPPSEPLPVFVSIRDGRCPSVYRMVEGVCALDGYLSGPALLEEIKGYKRGVAPMRMVPPTTKLPAQDGETGDWVTFESAGERFRADFPTQPKREVVPTETATGTLDLISYSAESGGFAYIAACVKVPDRVAQDLALESLLDNARNGAVQNSEGTLRSETRIETEGVQGREWLIATEGGAILTRMRTYYVRQHLYMVEVATRSNRGSHPNVAKFLDSFAFTL